MLSGSSVLVTLEAVKDVHRACLSWCTCSGKSLIFSLTEKYRNWRRVLEQPHKYTDSFTLLCSTRPVVQLRKKIKSGPLNISWERNEGALTPTDGFGFIYWSWLTERWMHFSHCGMSIVVVVRWHVVLGCDYSFNSSSICSKALKRHEKVSEINKN